MPARITAKAAVVIFARRPQLGRVKTRLVPPLTPPQALELHVACLQATARLAASLPRSVSKWLYLTGSDTPSARRTAQRLGLPRGFTVRVQRGRDLGARLGNAFRALWADGHERVVVIGSDSPTLSRERLRQALGVLRRADAVVGPGRDGGYYLIGLRALPSKLPRLFRGVDWGTPRAFRQTLTRLRKAKLRTQVLPLGYDVDTGDDLRRLWDDLRRKKSLQLAPLRQWLRSCEQI